ncbi:TRAP transporter small permease [Salinicoccus hispanicus]|uniref:TRAP transporter small permease subunit n=1 Tax=Salinicoccus hispanicus TaxID=157225 RepID=A0A6N8U0L1_9STAP|nr:TRAP transporter small permease [Salinicoccus hispanicus]MXQ51302.1 TRAP transporter small permease subunit [Salinicoccus hispanicus]
MKHLYNMILNICSIFFIIIVIASIAQVFFRFVLDSPLVWSDELSRFLLLWMVFLGASVVSYKGAHLGVDFLFDYIPPRFTLALKAASVAVSLIFLSVLVFSSMELLRVAGYTSSPALGIPMSYWRGSVVVGSLLMILAIIVNVFSRLKERKVGR